MLILNTSKEILQSWLTNTNLCNDPIGFVFNMTWSAARALIEGPPAIGSMQMKMVKMVHIFWNWILWNELNNPNSQFIKGLIMNFDCEY